MDDRFQRWLSLFPPPGTIRVVFVDVDGCLTAGEGRPLDFDVLAAVARINEQAPHDPLVPAVTLCTGRPTPYVEVLLQSIAGFFPALAEHGGIACYPVDYRFERHPLLAGLDAELEAVRARIQSRVVGQGAGFLQPGKETMFTLYPNSGVSIDSLADQTRAAVDGVTARFDVEAGRTGVEVRRRGVDKGSGLAWLAERTGVALSQVGGIGDSDSDLTFLERVAFTAAPGSAVPGVRAAVGYVAPSPDARGTLEALQYIEARNRAMG
jgi:hydroxymethylpyrimidine pyrophosphatase-like HAD family hydrolase